MTVARGYIGYEHSTGKPVQVAAIGVERSAGLTHEEALALLKKQFPDATMWLWEDL